MDQQLASSILQEGFGTSGGAAGDGTQTIVMPIDSERNLEVTRVGGAELTTLHMSTRNKLPDDPDDAADAGWAWLEASWARRLGDGIAPTLDNDGCLGFGVVLPRRDQNVDGILAALKTLDGASRANTTIAAADAANAPETTEAMVRI